MVCCVVKECKLNSRNSKRKFFNIPRMKIEKKKWLNVIPRKYRTNLKTATICDVHFKSEDFHFIFSDGKISKRLKKGSIPSLNLTSLTDSSVTSKVIPECEEIPQTSAAAQTSASPPLSPDNSSVSSQVIPECEEIPQTSAAAQTSASPLLPPDNLSVSSQVIPECEEIPDKSAAENVSNQLPPADHLYIRIPGSSDSSQATPKCKKLPKISARSRKSPAHPSKTADHLHKRTPGSSVSSPPTPKCKKLPKISARSRKNPAHPSKPADHLHKRTPGSSVSSPAIPECKKLPKISARSRTSATHPSEPAQYLYKRVPAGSQTNSAQPSSSPAQYLYMRVPEDDCRVAESEEDEKPPIHQPLPSNKNTSKVKTYKPKLHVTMKDKLMQANSKISYLETQLKIKDKRYNNLLRLNSQLKKEMSDLSSKIDKLSNIFSKSQIKKYSTGKKVQKWTEEDLESALAFKNVSNPAYKYAIKKLKYPLPSVTTLNAYAKEKKERKTNMVNGGKSPTVIGRTVKEELQESSIETTSKSLVSSGNEIVNGQAENNISNNYDDSSSSNHPHEIMIVADNFVLDANKSESPNLGDSSDSPIFSEEDINLNETNAETEGIHILIQTI